MPEVLGGAGARSLDEIESVAVCAPELPVASQAVVGFELALDVRSERRPRGASRAEHIGGAALVAHYGAAPKVPTSCVFLTRTCCDARVNCLFVRILGCDCCVRDPACAVPEKQTSTLMRTAWTEGNVLVEAIALSTQQGNLRCPDCKEPVIFVRASATASRCAYFRHKNHSETCTSGKSESNEEEPDAVFEAYAFDRGMGAWHRGWQMLAAQDSREVRGVGGDSRPRDVGSVEHGLVVEFQHSPIDPVEFSARNATVPIDGHVVWIFDSTEQPIWSYCGAFFCRDKFRATYESTSNSDVLFHCSDGQLRGSVCDSPAKIELPDGTYEYVRLLDGSGPSDRTRHTLDHFGLWEKQPLDKVYDSVPECIEDYIRVTSVEGREFVDTLHRRLFQTFPSKPLTVFNGPPGAGKTTLLKETAYKWNSEGKKVLVITFNRANALAMQEEFGGSGTDVKTLDSLCYIKERGRFDDKFSDKTFMSDHFPMEIRGSKGLVIKLKNGGGSGSASVVRFRLRNPSSLATICCKHAELTIKKTSKKWDASIGTFPISNIVDDVTTFQARRFVCDRDNLAIVKLANYDVVVVDEMQDLLDAQAQRLIRQAPCPVVMIGDMNQRINDFTNSNEFNGCDPSAPCVIDREPELPLPRFVEWYGTYRLDELTVAYLEDTTGKRMVSLRDGAASANIRWQAQLQVPDCTLLLARSNQSVIELCQNYDTMVVNGDEIAKKIKAAKDDDTMTEPMAKYAQGLGESELQSICRMLNAKTVTLSELRRTNGSASCTVHKAKGFEYDHVAVHADVLTSEAEIKFVAFSRHKESLTILQDANVE